MTDHEFPTSADLDFSCVGVTVGAVVILLKLSSPLPLLSASAISLSWEEEEVVNMIGNATLHTASFPFICSLVIIILQMPIKF